MPGNDRGRHQQHSPLSSLGLMLGNRQDQVHAMDNHDELSVEQDSELEAFQRHVNYLLSALLGADDLLSLSWLRKLLDSFLLIQEHFRLILINTRSLLLSKPPLGRLLSDFFDRTIKALDLCNAIRGGLAQIADWTNHLKIITTSLDPNQRAIIGDGQIRRAKRALDELTALMLDEKELVASHRHRNRSFGQIKNHSSNSNSNSSFRSLSWSVSRSWSAAKQLQAIGASFVATRGYEIQSSNGLANSVYTMNTVLLFVMWALVAAIPCQDRGIPLHFSVPKNFVWSGVVVHLYDKILEESKRKERRKESGLLMEIGAVGRCVKRLSELIDDGEVAGSEGRECVMELKRVCEGLEEGLGSVERQVREVFRGIARSRREGLGCLAKNSVL